jgi:hypothetical protein
MLAKSRLEERLRRVVPKMDVGNVGFVRSIMSTVGKSGLVKDFRCGPWCNGAA